MTAPLKWRSQLCPCGYCPDGTRIEWRYRIDIRFRPRQRKGHERPHGNLGSAANVPAPANPSWPENTILMDWVKKCDGPKA